MRKIGGWTAVANLAALRPAVFFAICEKPEEGGGMDNRLPAVRGLRENQILLQIQTWVSQQSATVLNR